MNLRAEDITIAVTVYDRRDYLAHSVGSALGQTVPVRVIVVEDCGPDSTLQAFVQDQFGPRVTYFRNPRRRGIFGNWNACIEACQTPYLSILHDDDYLEPTFVASMLKLNQQAGRRGLYFGETVVIDDQGNPRPEWSKPPLGADWAEVTLKDVLHNPPFSFPGQLFEVAAAAKLGGFRESSLFCGEWELWTKIIAEAGAAQTADRVSYFRDHGGWDRGTNRIHRSGKTHALVTVQRRRNLMLARRKGLPISNEELRRGVRSPMPSRYLIGNGKFFSPRYLVYNTGRIRRDPPQTAAHAIFRLLARIGGPPAVRFSSVLWHALRSGKGT